MVINAKVRRIRHINVYIFSFFSKLENMDLWGGCCIRFVGLAILLPKHANNTTIPLRKHIPPEKQSTAPSGAIFMQQYAIHLNIVVLLYIHYLHVPCNQICLGAVVHMQDYMRLPCITVDRAKHYIGTAYSGKEQLTCVENFSLIPSHHKTDKLAVPYWISVCKLFIKHHFVARKK